MIDFIEIIEGDTIEAYGKTLYRIRATRNFTVNGTFKIKKDERGGYVDNISDNFYHAWVDEDSIVVNYYIEEAIIMSSKIIGDIEDSAYIIDSIIEKSDIYGSARITKSRIQYKTSIKVQYPEKIMYPSLTIPIIFKSNIFFTNISIEYGNNNSINSSILRNCNIKDYIHVNDVELSSSTLQNVTMTNYNTEYHLRFFRLKLCYDKPDTNKRHATFLISNIGSRKDTLNVYMHFNIGDNPEKEADAIEYADVYVSTGCYRGKLKDFADRVERIYGDCGEEPNETYYRQYMSAISFINSLILIEYNDIINHLE